MRAVRVRATLRRLALCLAFSTRNRPSWPASSARGQCSPRRSVQRSSLSSGAPVKRASGEVAVCNTTLRAALSSA